MQTNQTRFENLDEVWIAKYRAAMNTPVPQSRFKSMCALLASARRNLVWQIEGIVGAWKGAMKAKLLSANDAVVISKAGIPALAVKRAEVRAENRFQEAVAKPKRPRPLRASHKYRAG